MQYKLAASDGLGPARVVFEIGGDKGQAIARLGAAFLEHRAYVALALQTPYGGAHLMARGQELEDGMAGDEARPAGNQNCAHRGFLKFECRVGSDSISWKVPLQSVSVLSRLSQGQTSSAVA